MYKNINTNLQENIRELSRSILELLDKIKNTLKKLFKIKEKEKTLNDYINELRDILLSHEELKIEFGAFAIMTKYLKYIFINKPQKYNDNKEFINNVFSTFENLLKAKLNYLIKRDKTSKEEYDKQYKIYDEKYYEYRQYFSLNIYENKHKYDKECDDIKRILME